MLIVSNQRSSLLSVWEEERSKERTLVLDTAKLLLVSALPAVDSRVLVVNLELLQLQQSQGMVRRVLAWLEELLTRVPVVGTLLLAKAGFGGDRIEFKLKLLFDRIVVVNPARPENFCLTPASQFWAPVLGYQEVKKELDKLIRWRFERKASLGRMGIAASSFTSHCLLHGPSGNGKTFIARNFARLGVGFLALKASDVFSKWFGDSERKIREVFAQARECRPCILFLDEIESLAPSRASLESSSDGASGVNTRVLSTLLNEIDGVDTANEDVVVVACTNSPHMVDDALLRPGRLGCLVHVGPPNKQDRRLLLEEFLPSLRLDEELLIDWLETRCEGMTVLEIENLCSKAKFSALRRASHKVDKSDFI
ncbi:hypothetical protein BASA81_000437 [Batrachochytrium salamandrivorans]|nr:hypothetical protein BASA81_000437 [Batrachochytrium salamandrivorans]